MLYRQRYQTTVVSLEAFNREGLMVTVQTIGGEDLESRRGKLKQPKSTPTKRGG
jgi:hypothetical protein